MVGKEVPVAPNAFAVTIMVEEVVAGLGLKLKATPPGTFTGPRPTDPEKPLIELIITWPGTPGPPCTTVKEAGLSEMEKSLTESVALAGWITFPFWPVTVIGKFTVGVLGLVFMIKVALLNPKLEKVPPEPFGRPETFNTTFPLNPPARMMDTVKVAMFPLVTASKPGLIDREKSPLAASWLMGMFMGF
jgi:hypothetical protein